MYNNLLFHQILHHTKPVVPKLKIRQYLLTERIFNFSNPWNSKHSSRTESKSTTVYHGDYDVDASRVEIQVVKGGKMSFSHSHHNLQRFFCL